MPEPFSYRYQPVLGTDLHVMVAAAGEAQAERAEARIIDEIRRLGALLSTYDPDTPVSRWMRGDDGPLPGEVITVLALAQGWYVASDGAFNPGLGRLRARWREAEQDGRIPSRSECADLAAAANSLPYVVNGDGPDRRVERSGHGRWLDLDALAKGWIVDRAAEAAQGSGVDWVMVNVGGDLRVVGSGSVHVAIEDPESTVDNAPALGVVTVGAQGLASSGSARRGYRVGGEWFGHILDPAPAGRSTQYQG